MKTKMEIGADAPRHAYLPRLADGLRWTHWTDGSSYGNPAKEITPPPDKVEEGYCCWAPRGVGGGPGHNLYFAEAGAETKSERIYSGGGRVQRLY
jgi:hypothetical protein